MNPLNPLKAQIKTLSAEQVSLKNQRKTVKLVGERTMPPSTAWATHQRNRDELRYLYAAYGILRGKDLATIDQNHADLSKNYLDKIVAKYTPKNEEVIHPSSE